MAERMPPREIAGIAVLIVGILASLILAWLFANNIIARGMHSHTAGKPHIIDFDIVLALLTLLFAALAGYLTKRLIRPRKKIPPEAETGKPK
jgi:hypothetical protein